MKRLFAPMTAPMTGPMTGLMIALLAAPPLAAHPHIFIDTGLTLAFDRDGRLARVKVTWVYDTFYSLLITEDMALDPDFDGVLSAAELDRLTGFDMKWQDGFNGDLEVLQGGQRLPLSGPHEVTAAFAEGRITTTHWRDVGPVQALGAGYEIRPFDATYYTAYDMTLPIRFTGTQACTARVQMPDMSGNLSALLNELSTLDADTTPQDAGLPDIGERLAQKVRVTCAAS
ncbi:MAG: ABC-type uncharacterized transport system substrate-binding protein [Sulfitobacter sp.]|jgi:ABC-type uncharacterized transport system substrate-binding protein